MKLTQFLSARIIRWLVVGFVFAGLGIGLLKLLVGGLGIPYAIATLLGGEISTVLRFFFVDRWVFAHRRPTWLRLWQYHIANATGFAVWWTASNALKAAGVNYLIASVLGMFFSVGVSMLSNFKWIWRKKPEGV